MVFRPGATPFPFIMAEIGMARAGRDDEIVVARCAVCGAHLLRVGIDTLDVLHQHRGVLLAGQDAADRHGDLRRRKAGGRHLVEQRLEQMVVAPVDDGDVDRRIAKPDRGVEASEPGAQNDDVRFALGLPFRIKRRSAAPGSPLPH